MATGTVKSFSPSKGYGFIRTETGKDIFVHLSEVRDAGLAELRTGQKLSFEVFDNRGKGAARKLNLNASIETVPEDKLGLSPKLGRRRRGRVSLTAGQLKVNRTSIPRGALELTITEAVRASDPECKALVGVLVERVVPKTGDGANWAVKGVRYGKAVRDRCSAAITKFVEEKQREFEVSDWPNERDAD
jgi:cold shock CspA family protein